MAYRIPPWTFPTLLLGLLLACCSLAAAAQADSPAARGISANAALAQVQLGRWSRVVRDPAGRLRAEQLLAHPFATEGVKGKVLNSFTFTHDTYWFLVPIDNPGATPLKRLLVFEPTWLDDIRLTLADPDGTLHHFRGGDRLDFDRRAIDNRRINFALTLQPGHSRLLVRVQTRDPFVVGMQLWERSAFYQHESGETTYTGLIYGVLGAMLLYNLMLFLGVREKVYIAYVAYVFCFILMNATYNGHMFQIFWPHSPEWDNWAHSIFIYLYVCAGLYFAINFLELPSRLPGVYRWARGLLWTVATSMVVTGLIGGYRLNVTSSILWVIVYSVLVLFLGAYSLRAGNRAARYFLPATTAGFVGAGVTAMAVAGLIPFSNLVYKTIDIGMLIDSILLSIALADRLKIARNETEQARAQLLETSRRYAEQLEGEVEQRTLELREANATKDKFFSIIAHDLRGPIRSLALFYNDIVHSAQDFTDEILTLTRTTTNTTSHLLEQLLTWARSQRGEIDYNPQPLELHQLLLKTLALFSAQASAKGIALNLAMEGPVWVQADRAMTQTILRNLINNALKYTAAGGTVVIDTDAEGDQYRVRITDTGVGIREATQRQLFRLDERPDPTPGTRNEVGTGLGLILCNEFVEKNGGRIGVESKPDMGSTFWFTLPRAVPQQGAAPLAAMESLGALTILVADDSAISRETSGNILRALGHEVAYALDGQEAVQLAASNEYDLILMDIDLPGLSGIEAARRIRAGDSDSRLVAWSSYSRKEIAQLAGGVRFDGYLDKPLSMDAMTDELTRLFRETERNPNISNEAKAS